MVFGPKLRGRCGLSAFPSNANCSTLIPGRFRALTELADVGRDDAQVLGDERQVAQLLPGGPEEILAGPGEPLALAGRGGAGRDIPGGGEAPEMVEAADVHVGQQGAQAVDVRRPGQGLAEAFLQAEAGMIGTHGNLHGFYLFQCRGHDPPRLVHDGVEMGLVAKAFRVELVGVLRARGPDGEPAARRDDLEAADRLVQARRPGQLRCDRLAGELGRADRLGESARSRAFCSGVAGASIRV